MAELRGREFRQFANAEAYFAFFLSRRNNINYIRMRPRARGHGALREREGKMPSYHHRTI